MSSPLVALTDPVVVLEEISLLAPLGIRFWDVATGSAAVVPLDVEAYPNAVPELLKPALQGRSGQYSFRGLPGLRNIEFGAGDDAFWSANPPSFPFTVVVNDPTSTYLPFQFSVLLPHRGFFGLLSSPLGSTLVPDASWIPIFSLPSRPLPDGMTVIRALLVDDRTGVPAAWAMVTAEAPDMLPAVGIADARGVISLPLLYPEPRNFAIGSPLRPGGMKLTDQTWPVNISISYNPGRTAEITPDLDETLQQMHATAWQDNAHLAPATTFTLQYGKDLVLRSRDRLSGRDLSVLLITPAGSPL